MSLYYRSALDEVELPDPPTEHRSRDRYFLGLDLGQAADYTALAIVRRTPPDDWNPKHPLTDVPEGCLFELLGLKRYPLGTPYPAIVEHVAALVNQQPLRQPEGRFLPQPQTRRQATVVLDATGVGAPVVDLFRQAGLEPVAITITGGLASSHPDPEEWHVPKRDLISCLQVLLQTRRLQFAADLPEAATLEHELMNFGVRITLAGHDTYAAWRENDHDDTVLALALACWTAQAPNLKYITIY